MVFVEYLKLFLSLYQEENFFLNVNSKQIA